MRRTVQQVKIKSENLGTRLWDRLGVDTAETVYICTPYVLGMFVIGAIGMAGHWATKKLYNQADNEAITAGIVSAPSIDLQAPDAGPLLIQSYTELQGGEQAWNNLESVEYNGIIFNEQEHHSFMASKSKDGSLNLRVTNRSAETELKIQGGQVAWSPEPTATEQPAFHVLSIAQLTREFYNPLMQIALTHSGEIGDLRETIWQNQRVIAATIQNEGVITELYLSQKDLTLLQRTDIFADGSQQKYRFSGYQQFNGLRIPTMVRAENNLGDMSNIRFTAINPILKTNQMTAQNHSARSALVTASLLK